MKQWWDSLQSREQLFILAAAGVIAFFVFYTFVWMPLQTSRQAAADTLEQKQELLAWIQESGLRLRALGPVTARASTASDRSVLATVDSTAKQLGVRPTIKRIEPSGDDQVTVWVEDMPFDSLMLLLGRLDKQANVYTQNAEISRSPNPGKSTAKIVLKRNIPG